ncbi:MAG: hypothetical protein JXA90_07460 [Planctomycetes bacterium]|nr:hypothetical protein [Planctomycetota bacterium]
MRRLCSFFVLGWLLTSSDLSAASLRIDDAMAEEFLRLMRDSEKAVLLHGSNGNRVWGRWALYAGMEHGVPVDATREAAAGCGVDMLVIE